MRDKRLSGNYQIVLTRERDLDVMEVQVEVEGYPLYLFNNHWRTDAGDSGAEARRLGERAPAGR